MAPVAKGTKRTNNSKSVGEPVPKKTKSSKKAEPEPESESELEQDLVSDDSVELSASSDSASDSEKDELDDDDDEDELDELDEQDENDDDDDDDEKSSIVDPNKKTSKEQHIEQRKSLEERKLKRKSGVQVQQIKSLWERLRSTTPKPTADVREKLCAEIWELSKDVVSDLVMKHDASRVVQTLVKFSSKERREAITNSMKGQFYVLATSSYGKYLLIKLLHYGSKDSKALILNELHGKLRKLMRHREGAHVVEDLYVLYSTADQRQQMIREFWGAEYAVFKDSGKGKTVLDIVNELSEKRQLVMSNLYGTINASVEKGSTGFQILHAAMREYTTVLADDIERNDKQIREFIELLAPQFAELVHTTEGAEVASTLIALANAKERKQIVKSLKQHGAELIKNENGNTVLITLFMTIDDTVLLHKSFCVELFTADSLPNLIQEKFSRRPLLYILKGLDGKYFSPLLKKDYLKYEKLAYSKTTKKPQDQRRKELVSKALPIIYKSILESAADKPNILNMLSSNIGAQFLTELIITPSDDDKEVNEDLRPQLVQLIFENSIEGDVLEDYHFLNKVPFITRSIKALLQGNEYKFDSESKRLNRIPEGKIPSIGTDFAVKVANHILENQVSNWLQGQPAFVVVFTVEVLQALEEQKTYQKLIKALAKEKKTLSKNKDDKGSQLLLKGL
ncbi:pumilio domain member 6 [Scheffersomyces spartinae]|uniref:Pumilio domain member 6 n=1 Tax=Scheffersomyces spartinae TaxID=45513 RepID=A0A9P8AIX9_9ASCO|nr:pumilio domain member 6 [Scheffersomyces spartinae]KAG7194878.1 pumilio domain member 6 [Scheffersomyces spartinae]